MIEPLITDHLFLRPLQLSDAARTQQLFGQWEITAEQWREHKQQRTSRQGRTS